MKTPKLTFIDNGDGSITVDRNGSYTCALFKQGGGGVESLAYEMAAMLSQAPAVKAEPVAEPICCPERVKNGGNCPHHNLHCGWPACNKETP